VIPDFADMELRQTALAAVRILLDTGAVHYDAAKPFQVGDHLESPLHVDARHVLGWPDKRAHLVDLAVETIERDIGADSFDAIACCTEGQGLPFAALIAERLRKPLLFVRRTHPTDPHKHDVEGRLQPGWRVLLLEQLAVDGHRKASLVKPLTAAGAVVEDLFVLFHYGLFDSLHTHLAPLGVRLHALATWWDLLEVATDAHKLPPDALEEIRRFVDDPARWKPKRR